MNNNRFDNYRKNAEEFDRTFRRMSIGITIAWIFAIILGIGVFSVALWATIMLVNHFTA